MNITDEELLMLEHLTYLNEDVTKAADIDGFTTVNLKEFKGDLIIRLSLIHISEPTRP